MRCEHCHESLPDNSRFCCFCGSTLPPSPAKTPTPPRYAVEPAFKTRFCRRCGKPVDDDTKRCLGCGKQYFRGVPPLVFLCIVLALALVALMVLCVFQEWHYHIRIDELEQLVEFHKSH